MRIAVSLLGREVWSFTWDDDSSDDEPPVFGTTTHNFDRDADPFDPNDRGSYDDRKKGFGFA